MTKQPLPFQAQDIAAYLQQNPDFFEQHPQLLESLRLPHAHGENSVSLVERQLQQFRQQRDLLKSEVISLLDIAGENSNLFEKVMQFNLTLMATQNEAQAVQQIQKQLQQLFAVDCVKLYSFEMPKKSVSGIQQLGMSAKWSNMLSQLLEPKTPFCGALEKAWRQGLFADNGQITSACLLPLGEERIWGVLALGRYDLRYESDFGHFFLRIMAQMVTAKLAGIFEENYQPSAKSTTEVAKDLVQQTGEFAEVVNSNKVVPIGRSGNKAAD